MPADTTIGLLRVLLSANTAEFDKAMKSSTDKVETFSRAAKQFGGGSIMKAANDMAAAVEKVGGVTKLTASEQTKLNSTLTEALAKYKALGQAAPAELVKLQKQTADLQKGTEGFRDVLGGVATGLLGLGAAAVGGLGVALAKSVEFASTLSDMSAKTGIGVGALQELQYAGKLVGVSLDDISGAILQMQKRLTTGDKSATGALKELGLSFKDLAGLKPEDQFTVIADKLAAIEDPALRNTLAMQLLGKTGAAVLPLLANNLGDVRAKAHELGLVLDDEAVKSLDSLGDSWDTAKLAGQALIAQVLVPLVPVITDIVSAITPMLATFGKWLPKAFLEAGVAFNTFLHDQFEGAAQLLEVWQKVNPLIDYTDQIVTLRLTSIAFLGDAHNLQDKIDGLGTSTGKTAEHTKTLTKQLKDADAEAKAHAEAIKKANEAADKLNESQRKLTEELRKGGVMSQAVVATALEPLIEKLNYAAQVSDKNLYAALVKLSPEFQKLRAEMVAAGVDTKALDDILAAFNARAGNTVEAMQKWEQSIPIIHAVTGQMIAYDAAAETAKLQTEDVTNAFHDFGLKSPAELAKVAQSARDNFYIVSHTAGVTRDQVKTAWDQMVDAQLAAQGRIPSQWKTVIVPTIKAAVESIKGTVADNFAAMMTHAEGFKTGFVNIWHAIRDEITSILGSILKMFVDRFLKGMLAAMTGAQGGFAGAFQGMFSSSGGTGGLISNLVRGGGAAAGIGGVGATGAVVGTGELAGVPIFSGALGTAVAPGAATAGVGGGAGAGLGGVGATIAGAGIIGGAGFGLGALGQKFFGRGAGAATFGGASGAGTGALIGTMVFPGIGTAVGALIGGLAGVVGGLVNFGASKKEKAARGGVAAFQQETFNALTDAQRTEAAGAGWSDPTAAGTLIAVRDAYIAIGKSGKDAERDVKAMWDAEKKGPEATAAAMAPMLEALDAFQKKQAAAATGAEDLTAKIDGVIAAMAPDEFTALSEAYHKALTEGFEGSLEDFTQQQLEFYNTLQEGDARLKTYFYGSTIDAFNKIADAGEATADKIGDSFERIRIPEITVPYRQVWTEGTGAPDQYGGSRPPGYASGTPDLGFVDFGPGRLVRLHGSEAVVPRAAAGAFAARHGGGAVAITIQAWDGTDVARVVNSPAFQTAIARRLPYVLTDNLESSRTATRRALGVD